MSSKQSDFYKSYMENLQKKAKEAVSKAQEKTFEEYFEVADTKIRDIYKKTIIDFYQDYTPPRFYDRRGSLFNLIQTKRGSDYLSIWFDPSKISYRNGYAGELLLHAIEDAKKQGRKGLVLTCKDKLLSYYGKFGFQNEGISASVHGNVVWYQMRLTF